MRAGDSGLVLSGTDLTRHLAHPHATALDLRVARKSNRLERLTAGNGSRPEGHFRYKDAAWYAE